VASLPGPACGPTPKHCHQGEPDRPVQESARGAVPTLQIPGDERHQHDQHPGDGEIAERPPEIATAT
jgi:hypothetical protein